MHLSLVTKLSTRPVSRAAPENLSAQAGMNGDPHLVGLKGQKFDFTGQENGYYSIIKDGPCNVMNMRVTAVPGTPEITYITGIGMVLCGDEDNQDGTDGNQTQSRHTVEIVVGEPHKLQSECPPSEGAGCLADGALTVAIDGEEMTIPGEV